MVLTLLNFKASLLNIGSLSRARLLRSHLPMFLKKQLGLFLVLAIWAPFVAKKVSAVVTLFHDLKNWLVGVWCLLTLLTLYSSVSNLQNVECTALP